MTTTSPHRSLAGLPKWAQTEIVNLRREVARLLADADPNPDETDTFYDPIVSPPRAMPRGSTVRFRVGPHSEGFASVHLAEPGVLEVYSGRGIVVRPRSTNVVHVMQERDR